jgi:ribosomal protein S12 methylthiotransferase
MTCYLEQLGCAKNQVDGETILQLLDGAGFLRAEEPENADIIIINSCGFIEKAKQESINTTLEFRKLYPCKKIILAGCLAQRYAQALCESMPEVDAFMGVDDLTQIVPLVVKLSGEQKKTESAIVQNPRPLLSLPGSAYIKIAEGCNNNCSFCAIPLIRGALKSRPIEEIYAEAKMFVERGIKEICLIAQDTASYGFDIAGTCLLDKLLLELSKLAGDFWVRLLYLHPDHFPYKILEIIKNDKRFLPYFDIPFQHSSPNILQAMNRQGSRKEYLSLINTIRGELDNAIIRSTFLTGFPGEKDSDFNDLLEFQQEAKLDWLGVFCYSNEDGVPAYNYKDRVTKKTSALRKTILEEKQSAITENAVDNFAEHFAGQKLQTLIEEEVETGLYIGRLFCHAPEVDGACVLECEKKLETGVFQDIMVQGRAGLDIYAHLYC